MEQLEGCSTACHSTVNTILVKIRTTRPLVGLTPVAHHGTGTRTAQSIAWTIAAKVHACREVFGLVQSSDQLGSPDDEENKIEKTVSATGLQACHFSNCSQLEKSPPEAPNRMLQQLSLADPPRVNASTKTFGDPSRGYSPCSETWEDDHKNNTRLCMQG